ncbi:sialidase family protein [Humibacillus xanthopallidus]|uniref:BNR repeat protein n=1 Tax=Humibacillus xanthopallidus TaxID=412689 RepID=A0A543HX86_9MICO|nr:sialidase family protein [Humibacillus xanthopallidus]TQM62952.1 BNR repeat protein [Humibacillus xanthopallidus]
MRKLVVPLAVAASVAAAGMMTGGAASAVTPIYDITTLAGKVASVNGTAGLQIRFSSYVEEESVDGPYTGAVTPPMTPAFVLSSPLDGTSVQGPAVTVNRDTAAAPQNETAIAVDPNNSQRVVAGANDYVTRTWSCDVGGTPCSALGDGYSGTYYSNDGGSTWQGVSSDPAHLGTLIPGVTHLTGGPYDAGGDPALTFDSRGAAYFAGLGFDRNTPPNTVTVNRGTFNGSGALTWSAPTFINPTTSPSVFNDKEWIAADAHASSPFRDRVYLTWTRFLFNPQNGAYVQSPIFFASSSDHGHTFTTPKSISGTVLYDQGSRPVVGPDGSLYVFFEGSTRLATHSSTYVVKSTDGGASWGKPVAIAQLTDSDSLKDTAFRVNSFPAAAVAPDGRLYATWTTAESGASTAVYSTSTDGGATWSEPSRVFAEANRTAVGYPVTQPGGGTLDAPAAAPVEDIFPAVGVGPDGHVYLGAYRGDVVSPWQTCTSAPAPPVGRISCDTLGPYVHNTRLDYVVTDLDQTQVMSTHPINTRYGFGGAFFGDYTDVTVGADGEAHALWTDSNNVQNVVWFYGVQFVPTPIHQQDAVIRSAHF